MAGQYYIGGLKRRVLGIVAGAMFVIFGMAAYADTLETLVMPGPVTAAHEKVENSCAKCHTPFGKGGQNTLCTACHEKVGADIKEKTGFHGRSANIAASECKTCHTDHKGRNFDIVDLNRESFDHTLTEFKLSGSHAAASCAACHPAGRKFRDAPSECISCHEESDIHHGFMGKDCASCHNAETWRGVTFDHRKTKFPLVGAHAKATCNACHPNERYAATPTACSACHGLEDDHRGLYGEKCDQCHTATSWEVATFDHGKTDFPLRGRHGKIQCIACHTPVKTTASLAAGCVDCHRADDVHKGGNGPACRDCHSETSWKTVSFNHDKDTKFPLHGSHKDVACNDCHKVDARKVKLNTACLSCHLDDDPHKSQLGTACNSCHNDRSWRQNVRFDHDLSAFPLLGLHASAPCEACHFTAVFKDAETGCIDCHGSDDVHKGSMGSDCAACHNPNGWTFWQFDHNTQTDFPLENAHAGLVCNACHRGEGQKALKITSSCISCHAADDTHDGRFGQRCDQCHGTDNFTKVRIRR